MVTKIKKKIKPLCVVRPRMSMYKKYFLLKDENFFDKYNEIWEKVINIIKYKVNWKLIYDKRLLKAENKSTQKRAFIVFINE